MDDYTVWRMRDDSGVRFAARELARYLRKATGWNCPIRRAKMYDPHLPGLWLGLSEDFPKLAPCPASSNAFDDEIYLRTTRKGGVIAGSNPRSVLLAAYRYLNEQGLRWVRPGKDGELVPSIRTLKPVTVHERAGYRHRGLCIEGSVSYEHVRDLVDWLPKVGMNSYFIQFREGYTFFDRWYGHQMNPLWKGRKITRADAEGLMERVCREIKNRDLILHAVGHGWTCEPFGIPGLGWYRHEGPIPAKARKLLAEVNGKRELWGGVALNTNLCYGNPETRKIMTKAIVDYAEQHPEVDIIHFWLADGSNNQCECPLCRDDLPADHYVRMLNELDARLTKKGLPTKIVFLIYVDLLWPPQKERIANPDRFILMFAPITRSYSTSFAASRGPAKIPPYHRNKLKFPSDPKVNLAFLAAWQQGFGGDGFDFDYHLIWAHYKDPGYTALADVLHQDLRGLHAIGLEGFNSCQVQRCFFPTGLPMMVMARTLWNPNLTLDEISEDYYRSAFGPMGGEVRKYLEQLTALFNPRLLRNELSDDEKRRSVKQLKNVPEAIHSFRPLIGRGLMLHEPVWAQSWRYLSHHAEICLLLSEVLHQFFSQGKDAARPLGLQFLNRVRRLERELHPVLDVPMLINVLWPFLGVTWEEAQGQSTSLPCH